jgi:DNA-binding MarR family transcriptional regulator
MDAISRARQLIQEFRKLDPEMPAQQIEAFLWLAFSDGKNQSEVGAFTEGSKSAAQRWFLKLGEKGLNGKPGLGLIEVRQGVADGRERQAFLTPKGRQLVSKLRSIMSAP